jgi:hypothetical protein
MAIKRGLLRVSGVVAAMCIAAAMLAGCGGDNPFNPLTGPAIPANVFGNGGGNVIQGGGGNVSVPVGNVISPTLVTLPVSSLPPLQTPNAIIRGNAVNFTNNQAFVGGSARIIWTAPVGANFMFIGLQGFDLYVKVSVNPLGNPQVINIQLPPLFVRPGTIDFTFAYTDGTGAVSPLQILPLIVLTTGGTGA